MKVNKNLVHVLRSNGYKVSIKHFRPYEVRENYLLTKFDADELKGKGKPLILNQKGGKTVVKLILPDGKEYELEEKCSRNDNFNYKRGYFIPLMRILKQMKKEGVLDGAKF